VGRDHAAGSQVGVLGHGIGPRPVVDVEGRDFRSLAVQ
jgi:hypothetical protein